MGIIAFFCEIDDFFIVFEHYQAQHQLSEILRTRNTRDRPRCLHPSEVRTILVHFHHKQNKNFKSLLFINLYLLVQLAPLIAIFA